MIISLVFCFKFNRSKIRFAILRGSIIGLVMLLPFIASSKGSDTISSKTSYDIEVGALFGIGNQHVNGSAVYQSGNRAAKAFAANFSNKANLFNAEFSFRRKIKKKLFIGGGFGLEFNHNYLLVNSYCWNLVVPVYMDLEYVFLKKKVSPYLDFKTGLAFYKGQSIGFGALGSLDFGVKISVSKRVGIKISIGDKFQHLYTNQILDYFDDQGYNTPYKGTTTYLSNFLAAKAGITF